MTTIAWDGKTIAHDSQSTAGNLVMANQVKSFIVNASDALFIRGELAKLIVCSGTAGDERWGAHFMRNSSVDDILELPEELTFNLWVFTERGNCYAIHKYQGNKHPSVYVIIPPFASGSGTDIAMTAMYLGQSASDAIITASVLDAYTDSNVKCYDFVHGATDNELC